MVHNQRYTKLKLSKIGIEMQTLFDTCVAYISQNINLVDSLIDFPDEIGKKIFQVAISLGKFSIEKNPHSSLSALKRFTTAYNNLVLFTACFEGEHLMLANYFEHILLFAHLRSLDVSSCFLGDNHDLLQNIYSFNSLEVLILHNNALSDSGIQKMTAPLRVMKMGPRVLQCLDFSGNKNITVKCLKFLKLFDIQVLNLSDTAISDLKHQVSQIQEFVKARSLVLQKQLLPDVEHLMRVQTQGWAAELVKCWVQECKKTHQQQNLSAESSTFYGRKVVPPIAISSKTNTKTFTHTFILVSQDVTWTSVKGHGRATNSMISVTPFESFRTQACPSGTLKLINDCVKSTADKNRMTEKIISSCPGASTHLTTKKFLPPQTDGLATKRLCVHKQDCTVAHCDTESGTNANVKHLSDEDSLLLKQYIGTYDFP